MDRNGQSSHLAGGLLVLDRLESLAGVDHDVSGIATAETKFSMADQWQRRLFTALCRRYGLEPYRYKGQRYTTVMGARAAVLCGQYTLAGIP